MICQARALRGILSRLAPGGLFFTSAPALSIPHMEPFHFVSFTPMVHSPFPLQFSIFDMILIIGRTISTSLTYLYCRNTYNCRVLLRSLKQLALR